MPATLLNPLLTSRHIIHGGHKDPQFTYHMLNNDLNVGNIHGHDIQHVDCMIIKDKPTTKKRSSQLS